MNTLRKIYESDDSGTVHVDVPIGAAHRRVEVEVTWIDAGDERDALDRKRSELEALAGALADDPLARPEQPVVERRAPIE